VEGGSAQPRSDMRRESFCFRMAFLTKNNDTTKRNTIAYFILSCPIWHDLVKCLLGILSVGSDREQ